MPLSKKNLGSSVDHKRGPLLVLRGRFARQAEAVDSLKSESEIGDGESEFEP